jgi:hypothetical protein
MEREAFVRHGSSKYFGKIHFCGHIYKRQTRGETLVFLWFITVKKCQFKM